MASTRRIKEGKPNRGGQVHTRIDVDGIPESVWQKEINHANCLTPIHKQAYVSGIDVDEGIAELLKVLWAHNFHTQSSCQGGPTSHGSRLNAQGGAFIVFNDFDQASRFHYKTNELLIDAVPQYWEQDHSERQQLGHNILRMARVGLTPMDPYNTATVRGLVELNWLVLPHITELWVKHYA